MTMYHRFRLSQISVDFVVDDVDVVVEVVEVVVDDVVVVD